MDWKIFVSMSSARLFKRQRYLEKDPISSYEEEDEL